MKRYFRFSDDPLASRCISYVLIVAGCVVAFLLLTGA